MGVYRLRGSGAGDEELDAFPREEPEEREYLIDEGAPGEEMFVEADIDELDRARADDTAEAVPLVGPPRTAARVGLPGLALGALLLIAAIGWGAYLYGRAGSEPSPSTTSAVSTTTAPPAAAVAQEPAPAASVPQPDAPPLPPASPPAAADPVPPPAKKPERAAAAAAVVRPALPAAAESKTRASAPAASVDLAGAWQLSREVESSSYNALTGDRSAYTLALQQDGVRVTGTGHKITENGRAVTPEARMPMRVRGTLNGKRLTLSFEEGVGGYRRAGTFVLTLEQPDLLRGRFSSNAANSKGTVEVRKQ